MTLNSQSIWRFVARNVVLIFFTFWIGEENEVEDSDSKETDGDTEAAVVESVEAGSSEQGLLFWNHVIKLGKKQKQLTPNEGFIWRLLKFFYNSSIAHQKYWS